jgi:hypothetical protein
VVSVRCPVAAARLRSGERALTNTYRNQVGCSRCGLCEHDQIMGPSSETAGSCSCAAGTSLVTIIARCRLVLGNRAAALDSSSGVNQQPVAAAAAAAAADQCISRLLRQFKAGLSRLCGQQHTASLLTRSTLAAQAALLKFSRASMPAPKANQHIALTKALACPRRHLQPTGDPSQAAHTAGNT